MEILKTINSFVWGVPTLILIVSAGVYLSCATGFAQLRLLPRAMQELYRRIKGDADSTSVRALCTALAATVGTGNIAGVAGAIAIGGPGSIFWMWICAVLGMIIKFAEALLAVKYCENHSGKERSGGPMYMIQLGLGMKWRPMAVCYCLFGAIAAFGIGGATQVNAVFTSISGALSASGCHAVREKSIVISVMLAIAVAAVLLGGARRIGNIAEILVPIAASSYMVLCLGALVFHYRAIPYAFKQIICGAFSPQAVTGGAVGSSFLVLRIGAARGTFTNEAGLGTAAIAHGTAVVEHPIQQGLMGIIEVFLDTIVICTMTAIVILTSGVLIPYGIDEGANLTTKAMASTYGQWISIPISVFLAAFAFAAMIGWGFYGQRCIAYIFGSRGEKPYILILTCITVASLVIETDNVWILSELVNGLMAIPNLMAILLLSGNVVQETRCFIQAGHRMPALNKNPPEGHR